VCYDDEYNYHSGQKVSEILTKQVLPSVKKERKTASERRKALREKLWPDIDDEKLWLRKQRAGFTTIPRTFNLIGRILDNLSGKGFPLSGTYLSLWCWVFDEAFVEIRNPKELSYESGFNGSRAESVWKGRMRKLEELGFILTKPGLAGEYQYVLLLNPIQVIESIFAKDVDNVAYKALLSRLVHVGADDIDI
jgi:hypothetical protein